MIAILLLLAFESGGDDPRPPALIRMLENRLQLDTGRIEFQMRVDPESAPLQCSQQLAGRAATMRFAPGGVPGSSGAAGTLGQQYLSDESGDWCVLDGERQQHAYGNRLAGVPDLRMLGMWPTLFGVKAHTELFAADNDRWRYESAAEGGLERVTAISAHSRLTWWIDPQRGWSPVRLVVARGEEVQLDVRSELDDFGGQWFPVRVEYISSRSPTPQQTVEIQHAEFNQPHHRAQLTAGDIGFRDGDYVGLYDADENEIGGQYWYGEDLVGFEELRVLMAARGLAYLLTGIVPFAPQPEADDLDQRLTLRLSRWEAYTAAFIARHKLDPRQARRAWDLCFKCQDRARRLMREVAGKDSHAEAASRLDAELRRGFDEVLKPGLKRLAPSQAGARGGT